MLVLLLLACASCNTAPATRREPVTGMEFIRIEPGAFVMGAGADEPADPRPAPRHRVRITRAFYLARHEVTQAQWQRVMGSNPSHFQDCPQCPVERVAWHEVQDFLARLRKLSGEKGVRLPTEAEWEYACRAGTDTPFSTGENITTTQANYDGRTPYPKQPAGDFRGSTTAVGSFAPNAWGLYDMHGNVWEWTVDEYCPYGTGERTDPVGTCGSGLKNIRGGSWYFGAASARCARRYTHDPKDRGFSIGLRLALDDR